jgi:hypothetical protein
MVNDLQDQMRRAVAAPPPEQLDTGLIVSAGRRRVRRRRAVVGAAALSTAAVLTLVAVTRPGGLDRAAPADDGPPTPDAPTISLAGASPATAGRDYEVVASHTDENLEADNGQYFDGVTDDGLVLFQDGPRDGTGWRTRFALLDPSTGKKDWLPDAGTGQDDVWPVELSARRLVLISDPGTGRGLGADVFDRTTRRWTTVHWSALPADVGDPGVLGPDGRLYLSGPGTTGAAPAGGWPVGPDGEADDAGAAGDTHHLWSVSLTDGSDVRDEGLTVGDVTFTDDAMVWSDRTNGEPGRVHVRDLATGEERSFDPHAGDRCNLLGMGAAGDRIVLDEYCGTYGKVRDDRVQVLDTTGHQVVTIQDSGIGGYPAGPNGDVIVDADAGSARSGTYVYDGATGRLRRISTGASTFAAGGGPVPDGLFLWRTPVNDSHGMTQWVGRLLD